MSSEFIRPYERSREVHIQLCEDMVLMVDPEYEESRIKFSRDLLDKYAIKFKSKGLKFDLDYPEGQPGNCYNNAMQMSLDTGLTYCEGLMVFTNPEHGDIAMPHAWCATANGRVYDNTCKKRQHDDIITYVGIPFCPLYALMWNVKMGFAGMLDGHPTEGKKVGVYADRPCEWLSLDYYTMVLP